MILEKIVESIEALSKKEIDIRFKWSLGYEGIVGNEEANNIAREMSS
jgi:hypothetical protein